MCLRLADTRTKRAQCTVIPNMGGNIGKEVRLTRIKKPSPVDQPQRIKRLLTAAARSKKETIATGSDKAVDVWKTDLADES